MHGNSHQLQGDPIAVGWHIGSAPLALRGIRFADGEQGGAPTGGGQDGGQPPAGGATPPAPSPAQLAAFYAQQQGAQPPAAPQQPTPPAVQQVQGFTPEQVQKLMADADAATKAAADAQAALEAMQAERDAAQAQIAEHARQQAVTAAADGKANAALLLDSAKFQTLLKDLDLTDSAALTAAVEKFVSDNPAYAAQAPAPQLPGTSGAAPTGGTTSKPATLEGAISAALSA